MRGRAIALVAALAAAGCAPMALVNDGLDSAQRRARPEAMANWQIDGRLAIDTGKRAFLGRFKWQESDRHLLLAVHGPLGAGSVRIEGTAQDLTVAARGRTWRLTDPEADLSRLVGWWVPVASLDSWLRGLPDADYPARTSRGRYGTLTSLLQRRWQLRFSDYAVKSSVLLPTKIVMANGPLQIKLSVDAFTSAPPAGRLN